MVNITKDEAMIIALDALKSTGLKWVVIEQAIETLRTTLAQPLPNARSLTDELMNCVDRLGSEADTVDPRVWDYLLVYAPKRPESKPVAMKFKIYKRTPPRGKELDQINSALLPWVYDQDPSSGYVASMWVTPIATLSLQRKPLTDDRISEILNTWDNADGTIASLCRSIEAAHGIKECS